MVVSDMDGTLLNSDHQVSEQFFSLFERLNRKGILFVAASGRQYHSIVQKLAPIRDEILVIAENGALVKKQEEELMVTPLEKEFTHTLLAKIHNIEGAHAMLCGKYDAYFDGKSKPFLEQLKEYYGSFKIVNTLDEVDDEIIKIAVYHNTSAEQYIYPVMKEFEQDLKVKISGQNWLDINHINAHKGSGLSHLMEQHGFNQDEVLVFGDYHNDLEMLSLVRYSFAMGNAHPKVKEIANYETLSNNEFGVEHIIKKILN